jgi:polysaccharide pyruvyl transferase WcaK-like protein
VLWLVDNGRTVRLFIGDTSGRDQEVVTQIQAFLRDQRPEMNPAQVQAEPVASFNELMRSMAEADAVVATRYHNLIGALLLGKPTIAIGYAAKHQALMDGMGMPEFHQPADGLDSDVLIKQFTELLNRSAELRARIVERDAVYGSQLARQWSDLSALLFPEPLANVQGPAVTPGPQPIA